MDNALANATIKVKSEIEGDTQVNSETNDQVPPLMASFFKTEGVMNAEDAGKVNEIFEWAKNEADTDEEMEILRVLKDVKFKLGRSNIDVKYLDHFHQYIKLKSEAGDLTARLRAMEE